MCKGLCFGNNGKYQLQPTVNAGNVKFEIWEKESENIFSTNDVTSQVPEKTFCDDDVEMMTIFNGGLFWHVVFVSFSKLAELRETVWGGGRRCTHNQNWTCPLVRGIIIIKRK